MLETPHHHPWRPLPHGCHPPHHPALRNQVGDEPGIAELMAAVTAQGLGPTGSWGTLPRPIYGKSTSRDRSPIPIWPRGVLNSTNL